MFLLAETADSLLAASQVVLSLADPLKSPERAFIVDASLSFLLLDDFSFDEALSWRRCRRCMKKYIILVAVDSFIISLPFDVRWMTAPLPLNSSSTSVTMFWCDNVDSARMTTLLSVSSFSGSSLAMVVKSSSTRWQAPWILRWLIKKP